MANYNSTYTGQEVDNAVGRALPDGTIDIDIRGKQDKLNQAQLSATNSGITAEKVTKYDGYEQELDNKQDALPDIVNDRYLHTNALTGELEWKVGVSKGTDDYNDLLNKPKINDVELEGNITADDLGVQEKLTPAQLDAVNSEVTSEWKNTIDGDITSLEVGKQDKLSQDQLNKINRALVSPLATENTKRIVMVDEQNNQVQLRVGDGLSINGLTSPFTLEAQGGESEASWGSITGTITNQTDLINLVNNHHDTSKQDVISDLSTIRSGASAGATALQPSALNEYATETYVNNHHDSTKQNAITSSNKLSYTLLKDTPTIPSVPTNVSAFTNDSGYLTLSTLPIYNGGVQ